MPAKPATVGPEGCLAQWSVARTLLIALGLSSIDLLWVIKPAVEPSQHALYHWSGSPGALFGATALDMVAAWLLLAALMLLASRAGRLRVFLWTGLLLFTPWFVLLDAEFLGFTSSHNHLARGLFLGALLTAIGLTAAWRPNFAVKFDRTIAIASTVLFFAGFFGLFLIFRLAWYGWQADKWERRFPLHQAQAGENNAPQPHRLIWIVLDELSFQQVYEHRYAGLAMPAFDKLATQATVFTHVQPIGIYTEIVLPGLLSGQPLDGIKTSSTGEFFVHSEATGRWAVFNQHETVFQDALDAGYGTGVAGWYNPYCRIMNRVLDRCMWTHRFEILNGMVPSGTVFSNALEPAKTFAIKLFDVGPRRLQITLSSLLHIPKESVKSAGLHIQDFGDLYAVSDALIRDRSAGFVLLHLPVPHPGGIYDRKTGNFDAKGSSYLDNLALADRCMAGLRATLEQTGQWNSSTVVVMGDHGWRTTQLWKSTAVWTPEEQAASLGGTYDQRPLYLIKLPGQTAGGRVDTTFHAVNTRKLFDAVFNHSISTPRQLTDWATSVR